MEKRFILFVAAAIACAPHLAEAEDAPTAAERILQSNGVRGGVVVQLGCGRADDGQASQLTADLHASDGWLVQGLDTDPARVAAARARLQALGVYGPVSAMPWDGVSLPYVDNLVNLIVVAGSAAQATPQEMLRVLAPGGVALRQPDDPSAAPQVLLTKPRPASMDDWTHYLHGPDNNAVSHDTEVGPPERLQWVGGPRWARHHDHMASMSAMVSANGRVFYIMDEGPRESILLPSQWELIARDAFNGAVLWKRSIAQWNTQLWPLKSGPNQLPRRLVAVGDRVYVTLGLDAAVSVLDAATGKTLHECAGTQETDEILYDHGTLYLLVAQSPNRWKDYLPLHTYVWDNMGEAHSHWGWDKADRWIMAVNADTGDVQWKVQRRVAPLTLTVGGDRLFFFNGDKVEAIERAGGKPLWTSAPVQHASVINTAYAPTLVSDGDVVLLSAENKSMSAFSAADGKTLWTQPHHPGGHNSPDDLLVIGGLVWSGAVAGGGDSGVFTGRDPLTGQVKSEFPPDVTSYWFHHRCYRSRATDRYVMCSRTGIEFVDLAAKHWEVNPWVRGGCLYGIMPANGLVYAPPNACGCYLESKLFGLNALAPAAPAGQGTPTTTERLERGPAYGEAPQAPAGGDATADWPTYRHDAARSGATPAAVPADLRRAWRAAVGGRLSSIVVAGGRLLVASIDRHTVYALDARTGREQWRFTADGRVDSPPTIWKGYAIFGSADGWIYCLTVADGRLAWRFRAAPADRRLVAWEQLESPWPVPGSALAMGDTVYAVAGRSAFLDSGMRMVRLEAATGKLLGETEINDRDPKTHGSLLDTVKGLDMAVALNDVLSSDGRHLYLRSQPFNLQGKPESLMPESPEQPSGDETHLFSRSGFLDDDWFFRSYWIYGRGVQSGYGAWFRPGHFAPAGRLIVFDDKRLYGFGREPQFLCNASVEEYYVYGASKTVSAKGVRLTKEAELAMNNTTPKRAGSSSDWALRMKFPLADETAATLDWADGHPPMQARAMTLAGGTIYMAGPRDVLDEASAFAHLNSPEVRSNLVAQAAEFKSKDALLLAVAAADGREATSWRLDAQPVWDGMAAADQRLFLSLSDGSVLCLGAEGDPLPAGPKPDLTPLDVTNRTVVASLAAPPAAPAQPPVAGQSDDGAAAAGFAQVSGGRISTAPIGFRLTATGRGDALALRKLPEPLHGKVHLKVRMQFVAGGSQAKRVRNGFIACGESADPAQVVMGGLRVLKKLGIVAQGTQENGVLATAAVENIDEASVQDVEMTVDLNAGEVTFKSGTATATATLTHPLKAIDYVGYAVAGATTDFAPIEIVGP